jgi:hypothetical protein
MQPQRKQQAVRWRGQRESKQCIQACCIGIELPTAQVPGVRWQSQHEHGTSPADRALQGRPATYRLVTGRKDPLPGAGVILSHSQPVLCSHVRATDFLPSTRLTPSLYSLCVCWCWVACYASPVACIQYCTLHLAFPSSQSPHLEFATATMPKKKGGKVQGRAKQKAKAQNASSAGGKPAWMKKFAKSFDDGRSLLPLHHVHMPILHTPPPTLQYFRGSIC